MTRPRPSTRQQRLRKQFFKQESGRKLQLERLEDRLALATVELSLVGSALTLTGDKDAVPAEINDRVVVDYDASTDVYTFLPGPGTTLTDPGGAATAGGGGLQVDGTLIDAVNIALLTGDDQLTVLSAGSSDTITYDGGAGNNQLTGPNSDAQWSIADTDQGQLTLDQGSGAVQIGFAQVQQLEGGSAADNFLVAAGKSLSAGGSISGGTGLNVLTIDDAALAGDTSYQITGTEVIRGGVAILAYADIQSLTLNAGTGNDTFLVASTSAATSIHGGAGTDTATVGNGTLDAVLNAVTVDGGADADSLVVNDSAFATGSTYAVSSTQITRGAVLVSYGLVENLTLQAGTGEDGITVNSTGATTLIQGGAGNETITIAAAAHATTIEAGAGNDAIAVGTGTLDSIIALITVEGGADDDSLSINDPADLNDNAYAVAAAQVTRGVVVDYGLIESLTLTAGLGADNISIASTGAVTTVEGGSGDDEIHILANTHAVTAQAGAGADKVFVAAGTLDTVAAAVKVRGGADADVDQLTIDDSAAAADNAYAITATQVARGAISIQYSEVTVSDNVILLAGTGNDTIAVESTSAATTTLANAGIDAVTIGNGTLDNLAAGVIVDGGLDGATLTINDSLDTSDNVYTIAATQVTRGAVTIDYSQIVNLSLFGGTGNDDITIQSTGAITSVAGGGGTDTIRVNANSQITTIQGGDGNDNFVVGTGALDGITAAVIVDGGGDTDDLTINDSGDTDNNAYTISATQVTRGLVTISYAAIESLLVQTGTGDDNVTITATGAETTVESNAGADSINVLSISDATTLRTGAGMDQLTVGTGTLDTFAAPLIVEGGSESDTLLLNDAADITNNTYTITATQVTRPAFIVDYSQVETLEVNAGTGNDTILVDSTGAATTINAGSGLDAITVGNGTLDGMAAAVAIAGDTGTDSLTVNDSADTNDNTYSITAAQVTRGGVTLNYSTIESLFLFAGTGNDTIAVVSTSAATTVQAGDGADAITVGGGTLDTVAHLVTINGGSVGSPDSLTVNDSADTDDNTYSVSAMQVTRSGGVTIDYSQIELLTVSDGIGSDTINVASISATTTVNAGDGLDGIKVGNGTLDGLASVITVTGDVGTDTLTVDDSTDADNNAYSISSTQVIRGGLTINYSLIENLNLLAGLGHDVVTVTATGAATLITGNIGNDTISIHATSHFVRSEGNDGNDTFHAGNGTLNNLLVAPTFVGSESGETLSREIRKGGVGRDGLPYFRPRLEVVSTADKLILEDGGNGGNARYDLVTSMASRNGVHRATFYGMEVLKLQAGTGNDDVVAWMNAWYPLPEIVQVDGGGGNDNRLQVEGTFAADHISIGDMDSALLGANFEVNQIERLWARGGFGDDVIDNISRTPGLMDGGVGDDLLNAIISTPPTQSGGEQTATILLGAEGRDQLFAGAGALADNRIIGFRDATGVDAGVPLAAYPDQGVVFMVGDYRLQSPFGRRPLRAVGGSGTAGDQYASSSAASKHGVLALKDNQTNAIRGRFQTIGGDKLRTSSIIGWLKAELRITKRQITRLIGQLNRQVAEYTKSPGAGPSASISRFTPRNINGK